jgi:hypothetical protein
MFPSEFGVVRGTVGVGGLDAILCSGCLVLVGIVGGRRITGRGGLEETMKYR